ncbi:DUF6221 family protein [Streptosporangium sp. NPDC004631]
MSDLIAFFRARLDEDERWALAASPGPWSENAESDEVLAVDGITVADGFALSGNQLRATVAHIARHDPARVLAEVAAKRRLLEQYERVLRSKAANDAAKADLAADLAHQEQTGVWAGAGFPDVRLRALRREEDYLTAMLPVLEGLVKAEVAVHADHKDYREEWKP